MEEDLIPDEGFELGMPSLTDMLRHQCDLLQAELDITQRDLRQAHKNLAGVICMWRDGAKELAALKLEHERVRWTLSDVYRRQSDAETSRMVYQYGDHTPTQADVSSPDPAVVNRQRC
jgi:hypothetical protein